MKRIIIDFFMIIIIKAASCAVRTAQLFFNISCRQNVSETIEPFLTPSMFLWSFNLRSAAQLVSEQTSIYVYMYIYILLPSLVIET